MKMKYIMILMGLLCLVSNNDLFSQHCFRMTYDKNGNRIYFAAKDCVGLERGELNVDEMLFENNDEDIEDLYVYPNPNNGRFKIELKNAEIARASDLYIYDNKGILVNSQKIFRELDVDISNNPTGAYLLRIIGENGERSMIVVKY